MPCSRACCRPRISRRSNCTARCAMPCSAAASGCGRCSSMRPARRSARRSKRSTHRQRPSKSSMRIRSCTTICRRWTTTTCAAAVRPAMSCSAMRWRSSPATRCRRSRSTCSRTMPRSRVDPAIHVEMLRMLAIACGSHGMAGGQAFDLAAMGQTPYAGRSRTHARAQDRRADPRVGAPRRARGRRA